MDSPEILLVGHYAHLSFTRGALLRSRGYFVIEASTKAQALRSLRLRQIGLIVLCQSLTQKECFALVHAMKCAAPATPIAVFGHAIKGCDVYLEILASPEVLLDCATLFLGNLRAKQPSARVELNTVNLSRQLWVAGEPSGPLRRIS